MEKSLKIGNDGKGRLKSAIFGSEGLRTPLGMALKDRKIRLGYLNEMISD